MVDFDVILGWIGFMIALLPLIVEQELSISIFQMNPSSSGRREI